MRIPDTVQRVSFHRRGGPGVLVHALFVVLYAAALQQCYNTVGEPYQLALAEQTRLRQDKLLNGPLLANNTAAEVGGTAERMPGRTSQQPAGAAVTAGYAATYRAELTYGLLCVGSRLCWVATSRTATWRCPSVT